MKNILFTKLVLVIFLILINYQVWNNYNNIINGSGYLDIFILDVGQGDSILIKTPNNHWALIDSGRNTNAVNKIFSKLPFTQQNFIFLMASHPDGDHIGGFNDLLRRYSSKIFFAFKSNKKNDLYKNLIKKVSQINNAHLTYEDDFIVDGLEFNILWPTDNISTFKIENVNNASYGIELIMNNFSFVSLGDLEEEFELHAINDLISQDIDSFKISHHGSSTSSSIDVLEKLSPKTSFISSGKNNPYGHPSEKVINNLRAIKSKYFRTDEQGTIQIRTDGKNSFKIRSDKEKRWKQFSLE